MVGLSGGCTSQRRRASLRCAVVRALIQRVTEASVAVDGEAIGEIGPGLVALIGATHSDGSEQARKLAGKIAKLRVMADTEGVMNESVLDHDAGVLVISQFTLYGNTERGNRPSWIDAAKPEHAEPLVDEVAAELRALGLTVATGRFRADMAVSLVNDGPVTIMIEV